MGQMIAPNHSQNLFKGHVFTCIPPEITSVGDRQRFVDELYQQIPLESERAELRKINTAYMEEQGHEKLQVFAQPVSGLDAIIERLDTSAAEMSLLEEIVNKQ